MKGDTLLTLIWWLWGSLLIVLLVVLSNLPLFGEDVRAAWEWFIPNLIPTMALVGGIEYQSGKAQERTAGTRSRSRKGLMIAIGLSVLYLLLLTITLFGALMSDAPLDKLRTSNLWLGPLLALNTAALGVRFARR